MAREGLMDDAGYNFDECTGDCECCEDELCVWKEDKEEEQNDDGRK